jgi:RNA polymerase sigma-70 factor, ECF subfamily
MQTTEKQVLSRIKNNDIEAYRYLFELYYRDLYFFAHKFIENREVAEEIVQDVFIFLWENRSSLNINKSIKSYLYTSVKNRSINYLKSKINNINFVNIEHAVDANLILPAHHTLELKELDKLIEKAISSLPPRCKEMFHLSRNSEMTYQEIADALDISKETVKSQISDALKKIKAFLSKYWEQIP